MHQRGHRGYEQRTPVLAQAIQRLQDEDAELAQNNRRGPAAHLRQTGRDRGPDQGPEGQDPDRQGPDHQERLHYPGLADVSGHHQMILFYQVADITNCPMSLSEYCEYCGK